MFINTPLVAALRWSETSRQLVQVKDELSKSIVNPPPVSPEVKVPTVTIFPEPAKPVTNNEEDEAFHSSTAVE